jgi:hypothetical protein
MGMESRWNDIDRENQSKGKAVPLHALEALGGEEL